MSADFLIVGGGIAGCATAAQLASLGRVTLLEAEDALGYHASGRSAALYEKNYGSPSTVALNRASRADLDQAGVLSPRGFLMVARPEEADGFDASRTELQMQEMTFGWPTEMMVKAAKRGLTITEVPVSYHPRRAGVSKVSGTLRGSVLAAYYILGVTLRYAR